MAQLKRSAMLKREDPITAVKVDRGACGLKDHLRAMLRTDKTFFDEHALTIESRNVDSCLKMYRSGDDGDTARGTLGQRFDNAGEISLIHPVLWMHEQLPPWLIVCQPCNLQCTSHLILIPRAFCHITWDARQLGFVGDRGDGWRSITPGPRHATEGIAMVSKTGNELTMARNVIDIARIGHVSQGKAWGAPVAIRCHDGEAEGLGFADSITMEEASTDDEYGILHTILSRNHAVSMAVEERKGSSF
jgi:hypothetical protein